jgi:hypothetical protein
MLTWFRVNRVYGATTHKTANFTLVAVKNLKPHIL